MSEVHLSSTLSLLIAMTPAAESTDLPRGDALIQPKLHLAHCCLI